MRQENGNGQASPSAVPASRMSPRIAPRCSRRWRKWLVLLVVLDALLAAPATAADLEVAVVDQRGAAVADAVVEVRPRAGSDAAETTATTRTIDQQALRFDPYLEIFRPGDSVVFRNSDRTNHHVYSFSSALAFETMVAPGTRTEPMALEQTGVIAVGCNIHDRMISYLYVSDAPWIGRTGADGIVRLPGLPAGAVDVRVWQPRLRPDPRHAPQQATLPSQGGVRLRFQVALRPDTRRAPDLETADY